MVGFFFAKIWSCKDFPKFCIVGKSLFMFDFNIKEDRRSVLERSS